MKPMLDCDSVMRQLWDYLDGELTEDRMEAIRAHLAMCSRCMPAGASCSTAGATPIAANSFQNLAESAAREIVSVIFFPALF